MKLLMLQQEAGRKSRFYTLIRQRKLCTCPIHGSTVSKLDIGLSPAAAPRLWSARPGPLHAPGSTNQSGATLVEVVIAATVLAIMIAGVLNSFGYGFMASQLARENQRATQIMLEKVETLRLDSWDQVRSNVFIPAAFSEAYDPQSSVGYQGVVYTGTVQVTGVPFTTSYSSNMRQIYVSLNWTTRGRIPHSRSITTFVAKDGLQNYVY